MIARAFRRVLLIELLFYVALGWSLAHYAGWTPVEATAAVLGCAIAIRAIVIAATFAIAGRYASSAPPGLRRGLAARLGTYFAEFGAFVLAYNLYQPFDWLLMREERLQPLRSEYLPVLLLHGYVCNRGFMFPLKRYLGAHGVIAYTHNLEPAYADIDSYVDALAQQFEEICTVTGAPKLVIVAHSMGGLAARAYLRKHGARRVAKLVTLGTPHHGTALARLAAGKNGQQMVPGNAWLDRLNEAGLAAPVVSVFSYDDNIVSPQASAELAGAKNLGLAGVGHISLPFSRRVFEIALQEIRAADR